MRVLGVDPGTIRTGFGVVEPDGARVRYVAAGVLKAPEKQPLEARLRIVYEGLVEVIEKYQPTSVAVEDIYFSDHANAALVLGHARGVALLAAARADLEVVPYPASVVKRTVVGKGNADKQQVARLVMALCGLREAPGVDATDALAIAITHLLAARMRSATLGRTSAVSARPKRVRT